MPSRIDPKVRKAIKKDAEAGFFGPEIAERNFVNIKTVYRVLGTGILESNPVIKKKKSKKEKKPRNLLKNLGLDYVQLKRRK